jgi:hypothetical protein
VPRFYLHVRRGREYALDREGYEFPSVEVARHEALRAAQKAWRRIPEGQDPAAYAIEVEHESGVMVLSVSFVDALANDIIQSFEQSRRVVKADEQTRLSA